MTTGVVVSIRRCSSDVGSEQLHLAVHAENTVVLQVLVVGRNRRVFLRGAVVELVRLDTDVSTSLHLDL